VVKATVTSLTNETVSACPLTSTLFVGLKHGLAVQPNSDLLFGVQHGNATFVLPRWCSRPRRSNFSAGGEDYGYFA
jgi:hypothetical protein